MCLCEDEGLINDPLVEACKCIGSVQYIHFRCLEMWLQSKCIRKVKNNIKFIKIHDQIICELCNQKFKMNFKNQLNNPLEVNLVKIP